MSNRTWAVITGASSGLGAVFADQLAARGFSLVLAGRDRARLDAVLRALDRGHAAVVPGWRNRVMATGGRILPGRFSALVSGRMLRPAEGAGSRVRS